NVNIIRHGIASLILFLAALYLVDKRWGTFIGLSAVAASFHSSMLLYVAAVASSFIFPLHILLAFCFVLSIAYAVGATEIFVAWANDVTGLTLLHEFFEYGTDAEYRTGVRFDF